MCDQLLEPRPRGRLPLTSGADPSRSARLLRQLDRPRLASPCLASPRLASPGVAWPRLASPCLALPGLQMRSRSPQSDQKVRFLTSKTSKMAPENGFICSRVFASFFVCVFCLFLYFFDCAVVTRARWDTVFYERICMSALSCKQGRSFF